MHQTHKAIGILGGTFDPIHMGHLRMALELYENLDLANVHLIPCYHPVHRKSPVATPSQRLAMVQCAVTSESALLADDREIKRQSPSYMIDTLISFREEMPQTPICLLLGIDAFLGLPSWHRWQELLDYAHLVIAHRPHYQLAKEGVLAELLAKKVRQASMHVHENLAGSILLRPITALEISATDIRKQIAVGKNPRFLIPDAVYDYIQKNNIYSLQT